MFHPMFPRKASRITVSERKPICNNLVLISQLLYSNFLGEPVNVGPELTYGISGLVGLKEKTAYLVVHEATHHFELHGSIIICVHVLQKMSVSCLVVPGYNKTIVIETLSVTHIT